MRLQQKQVYYWVKEKFSIVGEGRKRVIIHCLKILLRAFLGKIKFLKGAKKGQFQKINTFK